MADQLGAVVPEEVLRRRAEGLDCRLLVDDDNRIGDGIEDRAQPQLTLAPRQFGGLAIGDVRMIPTKIGLPPSRASPTERSIGNTDPSLRRPTTSRPIPMIYLWPVRK